MATNLAHASDYEKELLATVVDFARHRANETPPAEVLGGLLMDVLPSGNAVFWDGCAIFWGGERLNYDEVFVVDTTDGGVTCYTRFRGGNWV